MKFDSKETNFCVLCNVVLFLPPSHLNTHVLVMRIQPNKKIVIRLEIKLPLQYFQRGVYQNFLCCYSINFLVLYECLTGNIQWINDVLKHAADQLSFINFILANHYIQSIFTCARVGFNRKVLIFWPLMQSSAKLFPEKKQKTKQNLKRVDFCPIQVTNARVINLWSILSLLHTGNVYMSVGRYLK